MLASFAAPLSAQRVQHITPERSNKFWFETYGGSAQRFQDIASKAGADVLISNHTIYDGSKMSVKRYLTVANECAKAGLLRIQ